MHHRQSFLCDGLVLQTLQLNILCTNRVSLLRLELESCGVCPFLRRARYVHCTTHWHWSSRLTKGVWLGYGSWPLSDSVCVPGLW